MTKEEYKEMLKDILNNGAEYEFKTDVHAGWNEVAEYKWAPVDVTMGYVEGREYRKKPPKTWLEETFPLGDVVDDMHTEGEKERLGIKAFYEEFMRRVESKVMRVDCSLYLDNMKFIAKEMGVEVDDAEQ